MGCLIVGRRTYDILTKQPEFLEFKDVVLVVVSKKQAIKLVSTKHKIAESPKKALELLNDFDEVIVAGGGILNSSFIKENLIDEMYIDIEPIVFEKGISLFQEGNFKKKLQLLGVKKISDAVVQLHYKVLK